MKTQAHVRTLHDEWGKRALSLWLGDLGDVQIDARIAGESRRGDVLYTERRRRPAHRRKLEFAVQAEATRLSADKPGLYRLAPMWRTVIVVVNELPPDLSTLWLRLLGRGAVQAEAVRQLAEMSRSEPLRDATLELLIAWRQSLPPPERQSEDEQELAMNFERIYESWEKKTLARGRREGEAEGKAEGKAEAVLAVLDSRGLSVTAAQRKLVLACTDGAQLDAWVRAAATAPSVSALLSGGAARRLRAK